MEAGIFDRARTKGAQTHDPWWGPGKARAGDRSCPETGRTFGDGSGGELLRSRPGWALARPVLDAVGREKSGAGPGEPRSASEAAAGRDGSLGCAEATGHV